MAKKKKSSLMTDTFVTESAAPVKYVVAPGRSVCCARMVMEPGMEVTDDLMTVEARDRLVEKGIVVAA